jgi:DNA replication protein
MSNDNRDGFIKGVAEAMGEGGIFVPASLLRTYRNIGLSDAEAMLLFHLMVFRGAEFKEFPTWEELAERMGISAEEVGRMVQGLLKVGLLAIDEHFDAQTGVMYEAFNWSGWHTKAAEAMASQLEPSRKKPAPVLRRETVADLFTVFEQEFGRPLSPMECETISGWLDQDKYPDELIRFALKESVFAGKLHFRYIDRILLEWSRNRVTNADEARAHTQKFRGGKN